MSKILLSILFCITLLLSTANGQPEITFNLKTDFTTGSGPISVSMEDLNGDGLPDMAVANYNSNSVSVFLNTTSPGASTPTFSSKIDFATGANPYSISIDDLNGDGLPDLAVANGGSNNVSVLFNATAPGATTPSFSSKTDFATGTNPYSVSIDDLNGDGIPDLAVANSGSNNVSVLFNTTVPGAGTPTFTSKTDFTAGTNPYSVSIDDLNGDGLPDLAVANNGSNNVSVLFNTTVPGASTPSFSSATDFLVATYPGSVSIGDLNGDGKPDLAVTNSDYISDNNISVLINSTTPGASTPSFTAATDFTTGSVPLSDAISDLNGDGKPDIAVVDQGSDNVNIFKNTTNPGAYTPSFSASAEITTGSAPRSVSIEDLNGDGLPDMAVANFSSDNVSIYLNTTGTGSPEIFFNNKTDFVTATGPYSVSILDINGDGLPDLATANFNSNTGSLLLNTTALGTSSSSFSVNTDFATGGSPASISYGDLNGDGKRDLIVANFNSNTVSVYLNTTTPGAATPSFSAKTDFTTGSLPTSVSIGDLNGDGKLDIAVANNGGNSVSLFLNTTTPGASTPAFSAKTDFAAGTSPQAVSIGDLNGDGQPDLVVANWSSNNVSVLLNTTTPGASTPTFSAKTDFTTGLLPSSVYIEDLNGDGLPDLTVTNWNSSSVSVLLNTTTPGASTPTFSARTDFTCGSHPFSLSVGDLNGDGLPDLAVGNQSSNTVSVLTNTTSPGATTPSFSVKSDFSTGSTPKSVSIGDLNGDGKLDLAVANNGSSSISVLLNDTGNLTPPGDFDTKYDFATGAFPQCVSIGDFNCDGLSDLALANYYSTSVSVFLNTTAPGASTPSYTLKTDFTTGTNPASVSIKDMNGDGKPDLAVTNQSSNTLSVLLNTTSPGALTPSFSSKTDFTTGSGPSSVSISDLNGDGKPDLAVANVNSNSISILLSTTSPGASTPTFSSKTDFTAGTNPTSVSIKDLNGDGRPDMVAANENSNSVSVLLNTTTPGSSTPTFSAKTDFTTGNGPYSVSLEDLNGDGLNDIAATNFYASGQSVSILLNTTTPGASTPTFSAKTDFTTGSNPRSVSIGDLNGDGLLDLVVANQTSNSVSEFLNTTSPGASIPTFDTKTDIPAGSNPYSVSMADLNGDGKLDLAVANSGSNSVSVFLNTINIGTPIASFGAGTAFTTEAGIQSVTIGDLNGDGKPDLATANYGTKNVSVLFNTTAPGASTPSFSTKTSYTTGEYSTSVSIGDLNGDGMPDLAVANGGNYSTITVFLNTTTPGASSPSFSAGTDFVAPRGCASIAIGDFNGDGKADLAVANSNFYSNNVSVFFNTTPTGATTPSFSTSMEYFIGIARSVSIGDLNGDGKLDLAVTNGGSNSFVSILLNTTSPGATAPSFSSRSDFTTGTDPVCVSIGDINGDGKLDLAVANNGSNNISVLLNITSPGATTPSFSNKTDFTTGTSPRYVSLEDLNGDGKLDLAAANVNGSSVSVLINSTIPGAVTPSFLTKMDYTTAQWPYCVSIGDLNGDGKPDLALANNGYSNVSVFLNSFTPFPVELTSFSASVVKGNVRLVWNTATEVNNYGFEIERSSASENWSKMGFIEGHGNSNSPKEYSFIDDKVVSGKYSYRLKQIDNDGNFKYSKVIEIDVDAPKEFTLSQNYPNPFNPTTTIKFAVAVTSKVKLSIYNILGEQVQNLVNEIKEAGNYKIIFNASRLASGIYFYRLKAGGFTKTKKMLLIK